MSSTLSGSQATTNTRPGQPPTYLTKAQHGLGIHPVGIEHLTVLDLAVDVLGVGLHHVERARGLALPADVDQDKRVIAAHHLIGQVQPTGPEVDDLDAGRQLTAGEQLGHLSAEAVISQPGVADPGDEDLLGSSCAAGWPPVALGLVARSASCLA